MNGHEGTDNAVFVFGLEDGTVIEIHHPRPLTVEEGHRESCRWAERLEMILPNGQQFAEAIFIDAAGARREERDLGDR